MIVTLTTDFGPGPYVAEMKGVILEIDPAATIVDLDHSVDAQDIRQGAYAILSAAPYFPFAIHLGIVDPGVGTARGQSRSRARARCSSGPTTGS